LAYQRGRYERAINYQSREEIFLEGPDRQWIADVAAAGHKS
jgi:hypothetical protein